MVGQPWEEQGQGRKLCLPEHSSALRAQQVNDMTPLPLHSISGHQSPSPRAPKPVFQASGVCRSDVLTAQVAKATNTRHMSFWLKVKAVRGPRGSPRKEKHTLSSSCFTQTWLSRDISDQGHICPETCLIRTRLPWTHLSGDTSVWRHIYLGTCLTWDMTDL